MSWVPVVLSAVALGLALLALCLAMAFVNPWRDLECQALAPEPETLTSHPAAV